MYVNFQCSYCRKEPEPLLKKEALNKYVTLILINFSKQNEFLKRASGSATYKRTDSDQKIYFQSGWTIL